MPRVTFVQPPVLTRSQFRLCLEIQREFLEQVIRIEGANYRVAVVFAYPRRDNLFIRPLWRLLQYDWVILQIGVPRYEEEWDYVYYWGRTNLPYGIFKEDDRICAIIPP